MKNLLKKISSFFKKQDASPLIYEAAYKNLGKILSDNLTYGDADTVNAIVEQAIGKPIGGGNSSHTMRWIMDTFNKRFVKILYPNKGNIIICATGLGKDPEAIGHVGIVGPESQIFSQNPINGKFDNHLTLEEWKETYKDFQTEIFKVMN